MITADDLIRRFGVQELIALTDKDGLQSLNETVLNQAIADAKAFACDILGASIDNRLLSIRPAIGAKICDIARFYLYDDNVTETVKLRYTEAINYLKGLNPADLGISRPLGQVAVMANPVPTIWQDSPLNQNDPVYY